MATHTATKSKKGYTMTTTITRKRKSKSPFVQVLPTELKVSIHSLGNRYFNIHKKKVSFNLPMKCGNIKGLPNISVNLDILGLDYIIKTEENIVNVDEHKVVIKSLQDENIGLFAKVKSFFKM